MIRRERRTTCLEDMSLSLLLSQIYSSKNLLLLSLSEGLDPICCPERLLDTTACCQNTNYCYTFSLSLVFVTSVNGEALEERKEEIDKREEKERKVVDRQNVTLDLPWRVLA